MAGGPSHLETFDFKPKLVEMHGSPMPESFMKGRPIAQLQDQKEFNACARCSRSGGSERAARKFHAVPAHRSIADDIRVIRLDEDGGDQPRPGVHVFMNTRTTISGRPSMGSWVTYGLGSEASDLPGFVVLMSTGPGRPPQPIHSRHQGRLPAQPLPGRAPSEPGRPGDVPFATGGRRRGRSAHDVVDAVSVPNRSHERLVEDPEIATRISQYEMAFAMQASVPELMRLSNEPRHVLDMYGTEVPTARTPRIASSPAGWPNAASGSSSSTTATGTTTTASKATSPARRGGRLPTVALIRDLKSRSVDDTLVVWGGEFGRTPMAQTNKGRPGRDHHMKGFSMWLAGGGIRGGITHGATDELGYNAVEDVVHVHDLHATMLHLLGVDHKRLHQVPGAGLPTDRRARESGDQDPGLIVHGFSTHAGNAGVGSRGRATAGRPRPGRPGRTAAAPPPGSSR